MIFWGEIGPCKIVKLGENSVKDWYLNSGLNKEKVSCEQSISDKAMRKVKALSVLGVAITEYEKAS